jgi:hypothetical protein
MNHTTKPLAIVGMLADTTAALIGIVGILGYLQEVKAATKHTVNL